MNRREPEFISDEEVQALVRQVLHRLQEKRESRGISMYRVAKLTGLHASTIGLVERGERSPSLFVVFKIALALELPLGRIISECLDEEETADCDAPELADEPGDLAAIPQPAPVVTEARYTDSSPPVSDGSPAK